MGAALRHSRPSAARPAYRRHPLTLALLAVAALTSHQPGHLGRAGIGAAALACFYLALSLIRPGGMGLGVKLAASVGAALGWTRWQALLTGAPLPPGHPPRARCPAPPSRPARSPSARRKIAACDPVTRLRA
jgi:Type IV leader peptidase family